MEEHIEKVLGEPMRLTDIVRKACEEADLFKHDCAQISDKVQNLSQLIRSTLRIFIGHGARSSNGDFYDRPARRILVEASKALDKALSLCRKCRRSSMLKCVIRIVSSADFRRVNILLDGSIGDLVWLLNVSSNKEDRTGIEGLPPIASTDPMVAWVWGHIALVYDGKPAEKEDGASYLASLAADNDRNRKLIIEEGGVPPLLKLLKEGTTTTGRLAAATVIGALAADEERVLQVLEQGAVPVLVAILQDGPMKLQAKIALIIAQMASKSRQAQSVLASDSIIRPLVSLLVFQTLDVNLYNVFRERTFHTMVKHCTMSPTILEGGRGWALMKSHMSDNGRLGEKWEWDDLSQSCSSSPMARPHHSRGYSDFSFSSRELARMERLNESTETKHELKANVTCALWKLLESNTKASWKITDTKALICLSKVVEKETGEVQSNAVGALMQICVAAEKDTDLRRFAFKSNSPGAKAVVQQLVRIIEVAHDPTLQIPCLRALGCLARTFPASETRVIALLVQRVLHSDHSVVAEAAWALQKFVQMDNFLRVEHSRTIVEAGCALTQLVRLVFLNDKDVQVPALLLLSYLALHIGHLDLFQEAGVLKALKADAASTNMAQTWSSGGVLSGAIRHLELYQAAPQSSVEPSPILFCKGTCSRPINPLAAPVMLHFGGGSHNGHIGDIPLYSVKCTHLH